MEKLTVAVTICLLMVTFFGLPASSADQTSESNEIGTYTQLGVQHYLTQEHVSWTEDHLTITGPVFTSKLQVHLDYLEQRILAWAADKRFTTSDNTVEFAGRSVNIFNWSLTRDSGFTWGSYDQLRLVERPMWVNANQPHHGSPVTVDLNDGDSSGQTLYISSEWLWSRGIHKPRATHEDGTDLEIYRVEGGEGYTIEVPHFSEIVIESPDIQLWGGQGGNPHVGDVRWIPEEKRLEIDVLLQTKAYDLWVEKAWVDSKIITPALEKYVWVEKDYDGDTYYVVTVPAKDTPDTVVFRPFVIEETPLFSLGSPEIMLFNRPIKVTSAYAGNGFVAANHSLVQEDLSALFNSSYIGSLGILNPDFWDGNATSLLETPTDGFYATILPVNSTEFRLAEQSFVLRTTGAGDIVTFNNQLTWHENEELRIFVEDNMTNQVLIDKKWIEAATAPEYIYNSQNRSVGTIAGTEYLIHDCCENTGTEIVYAVLPSSIEGVEDERVWLDLDRIRTNINNNLTFSLELFDEIHELLVESVNSSTVQTTYRDVVVGAGSLQGDNSSEVMLHVSADGVDGIIVANQSYTIVEPYIRFDPLAEPNQTIIRRVPIESELSAGNESPKVQSHRWITLLAYVDQEMIDEHDDWDSWVRNIISKYNEVVENTNAPRAEIFLDTILRCDDWTECESTDSDTLLDEWAQRVYSLCSDLTDCKDDKGMAAHLFTGKLLNNGGYTGVSYLPGRYSLSMAVDHPSPSHFYDGGSVLHEATALFAHEMGHMFYGQHDDAKIWDEELHASCTHGPYYQIADNHFGCVWVSTSETPQYWYRCSYRVFVPVGDGGYGICAYYETTQAQYATLMAFNKWHEPENEPPSFIKLRWSSKNSGNIGECWNALSGAGPWEEMPLSPGDHAC